MNPVCLGPKPCLFGFRVEGFVRGEGAGIKNEDLGCRERVDLVDLPLHLLALRIQLPHGQGLSLLSVRVLGLGIEISLGERVSSVGIKNLPGISVSGLRIKNL